MENLTPMLRQYKEIKSRFPGSILFFRLGDFYEMFFEDARTAAPILDVVLTSRDAGKTGRIPMCGIPYHAKDSYIAKLIRAGHKVAICDQTEDPALAKGLVKRDITRIISSGTFIDESSYEPRYILCLTLNDKTIGFAFADSQTGKLQANQFYDKNQLIETISRLPVYECLFPACEEEKIREIFKHPLLKTKNITLSPQEDWTFNTEIARKSLCEHFQVQTLRGFGIDDYELAVASAGALLEYMKQMNRQPMRHMDTLSLYTETDYVFISPAAFFGLGLEDVFKTIDRTLTAMGKRCLRNWMYRPLKDKKAILERQNAVAVLREDTRCMENLHRHLHCIPDIEKSLSRISCGIGSAKDLTALRNTITRIPEIQTAVSGPAKKNRLFSIEDIPEIRALLDKAINPDIPLSNPEGKIINTGYHEELDSLRDIQENGRQLLKKMQEEEIKKSGINSLKIGFNGVFGYYIEITRANLASVPAHYIRRQTLANAERYVTPELKEFEEKMLTAESNVLRIEKTLVEEIYKKILNASSPLHEFASKISCLDALYSLAKLSLSPGYTAPEINESKELVIKDGRHPVVEQFLNETFVPNDTVLDCENNHLVIITGPNMSGKSTYIRQSAILVIMAHMGSYLPAREANIGIVDKIFTRIGAHDEITKGQSTFMVEMSETAGILNNLSDRSLVILDEIGRGTSTYDGLSLAWAIAEYLEKKKTRTLFATHFHELTVLAEDFPGVKNYNVSVKEWNDEIIFLHKIIPGGTDESYGIYVAKIAGIPKDVIQRSRQILTRLELSGKLHDKIRTQTADETQLSLFKAGCDENLLELKEELEALDINALTPLEALNKIQELKEKVKDHGTSARTAAGNNQ
ncbi:MAG: DNA mismatch repair protein MutS [Candidatus Omnitrophica bacterium]|nr:DNA mismatch repair protein MutS [Candidatus Omnitrophota bacterium]